MKTVLITGASSSIGRPLTQQLINQGYQVLAHYRRPNDELNSLKKKFTTKLHLLNADLGNSSELRNFTASLESFGPLFAVVHLPSPQISLKPLPHIEWMEYEQHLNVQLKSLQQIVQSTIRSMKKAREGYIISIGSDAIASEPTPKGFTAYAVAKAALHQFLKSLAAEYFEYGLHIVQITPRMFKSPLLDELPEYVIEQTLAKQSVPKKKNTGNNTYQAEISNMIINLLNGSSNVARYIEIQKFK